MPLVGGETSGMLSRLGDRMEGRRKEEKTDRGEMEKGSRERGRVRKQMEGEEERRNTIR